MKTTNFEIKQRLKQIAFKIARLSNRDQLWLFNALTAEQRQLFQRFQGEVFLDQAKRFQKLDEHSLKKTVLPPIQKELATYSPLFIAVVLEQGKYVWEEEFLKLFDNDNQIKKLLLTEVKSLKNSAKQELFKQWENQHAFEIQSEMNNGNSL